MHRRLLLLCTLTACAAQDSSSREQAVTNGMTATGDPAVIAIADLQGTVGCTATVIGSHTAITAAHCFVNRKPTTLRVYFGTQLGDGGTFIAISDARSHPDFDFAVLSHDIAMVTLRDESPAAPVALDMRTLDSSLVGTDFRVVGFGSTTGTTADAGTKREGIARVSEVAELEFTATPNPSQPCRGDSGGPAFLSANEIAGVVSRGDGACSDHVTYTRIDAARSALVNPYFVDTAPMSAHTGEACLFEGHCVEGPCLQTKDESLLWFCSEPCDGDSDCPYAMECASDGCRYPEPSPGALGYVCDSDNQCESEMCRESVCTISCQVDPTACPADFECRRIGVLQYCLAKPDDDCGSCSSGSHAPLWLVVIYFVRRRRRLTVKASNTSATLLVDAPEVA